MYLSKLKLSKGIQETDFYDVSWKCVKISSNKNLKKLNLIFNS